MCSPFSCGSFHHQEEEDCDPWSPSSTPRKSRKNSFCSRTKDNKNPYSDRGLDKFSALLADLDDKRQKIYTQKGSEEISLVRFVYSNSNHCKPIVVKMREKKQENIAQNSEALDKNRPIESSTGGNEVQQQKVESDQKTKKKMSFKWNYMSLDNWWRPSYYLPMIIILILLFLAMFGRTFAILCTSIGWYLIPTIRGGTSNSERPKKKKKKEFARRFSDVKIESDGITSPTSVITGLNNMSPPRHVHGRSW